MEKINALGHKNILCTHNTTLEITKEKTLTKKGNCIVGINASKACYDINPKLKEFIKSGKKIKITLKVNDVTDSFFGFGNKELTLLNKKDMVFRKSNFLCDRTILINCSKSSSDLDRNLIEELKVPNKKILILFEFDSNGK
ncbi:MAG: DUF371 domain-containing protein [Promethearchaeota archaeon]